VLDFCTWLLAKWLCNFFWVVTMTDDELWSKCWIMANAIGKTLEAECKSADLGPPEAAVILIMVLGKLAGHNHKVTMEAAWSGITQSEALKQTFESGFEVGVEERKGSSHYD
jgi:hypothetical protein